MSHADESLKKPHQRVLFIIGLSSLISWAAWILVVLNLDPFESTWLSLTLFFISLSLALVGTYTLILFFLKKLRSKSEIYTKHAMISLRQGTLLGICTILCLGLLMLGLLRIWNGLLVVFLMTMIEFYLSGKDELN